MVQTINQFSLWLWSHLHLHGYPSKSNQVLKMLVTLSKLSRPPMMAITASTLVGNYCKNTRTELYRKTALPHLHIGQFIELSKHHI